MPMLRVEFHCHTNASGDSLTRPADLVRVARRTGLDRLVITDHNTIAGAQAAQALDPELVIVGEEILTTRGELLCAFVTEEVPAHLTPLEAIRRLRDQGAFISVSHPFDRMRKGAWQINDLLEIAPLVDAIEVFNARCLSPAYNAAAKAFAEQYAIPGTVGSDAHGLVEVGRSFLELEQFTGAEQMRQVIRRGVPRAKASPWWVHLISRYASMKKRSRSE